MLCVSWHLKLIVHHELSQSGESIVSIIRCEYSVRLRRTIKVKQLELIDSNTVDLHHSNARPPAYLEIR